MALTFPSVYRASLVRIYEYIECHITHTEEVYIERARKYHR